MLVYHDFLLAGLGVVRAPYYVLNWAIMHQQGGLENKIIKSNDDVCRHLMARGQSNRHEREGRTRRTRNKTYFCVTSNLTNVRMTKKLYNCDAGTNKFIELKYRWRKKVVFINISNGPSLILKVPLRCFKTLNVTFKHGMSLHVTSQVCPHERAKTHSAVKVFVQMFPLCMTRSDTNNIPLTYCCVICTHINTISQNHCNLLHR